MSTPDDPQNANDLRDQHDPHDLDRFDRAQRGVHDQALAELRAGRKTSHWMWFVFPQLRGLGSSPTATRYGIASLEEARAYLRHPVLGPRLAEATSAVLHAEAPDVQTLLGGIDALKLRSSMTLFARAAGQESAAAFTAVLDRWFDGEDAATVRLLGDDTLHEFSS